jgi:hypothetical protein
MASMRNTVAKGARAAAELLAGAVLCMLVVVGGLAIGWCNPLVLVVLLAPYLLLRMAPALQARRVVPTLSRRARLDVFLGTGWLAASVTLASIEMRFPLCTAGSSMHGAGVRGGEQNALLFPWIHLVLHATALHLLARVARRTAKPRP